MRKEILFIVVVLLANIIQGITGFAGTILAMPPGLLLVGYDVAKPILNVLALLSGLYVFVGKHEKVEWREVRKIVLVMAVGILGGLFLKQFMAGREALFYRLLGCFVVALAVKGVFFSGGEERQTKGIWSNLLLLAAGVVHGIFVSGGPLLIGYLSGKIREKENFRATISTVWIVLNTIILMDDIRSGYFTVPLLKFLIVVLPALFLGMWIGSRLYVKMSQKFFMGLTYILLFVSGISLFLKG